MLWWGCGLHNGAFIRSGNWNNGSNDGPFTLNLNWNTGNTNNNVGFRCARYDRDLMTGLSATSTDVARVPGRLLSAFLLRYPAASREKGKI